MTQHVNVKEKSNEIKDRFTNHLRFVMCNGCTALANFQLISLQTTENYG